MICSPVYTSILLSQKSGYYQLWRLLSHTNTNDRHTNTNIVIVQPIVLSTIETCPHTFDLTEPATSHHHTQTHTSSTRYLLQYDRMIANRPAQQHRRRSPAARSLVRGVHQRQLPKQLIVHGAHVHAQAAEQLRDRHECGRIDERRPRGEQRAGAQQHRRPGHVHEVVFVVVQGPVCGRCGGVRQQNDVRGARDRHQHVEGQREHDAAVAVATEARQASLAAAEPGGSCVRVCIKRNMWQEIHNGPKLVLC